MSKPEDLSDIFTKDGLSKLKKGQLLRFNFEGSVSEYIITDLNKKSGKVLARSVVTHDPNHIKIKDAWGEEPFDTSRLKEEHV